MLQEDYIMRLFQQFNELLGKWLNKKKFDNIELVVSFNDEVVKPYLKEDLDFFEAMAIAEIKEYFTTHFPNLNERLGRLNILAESFYQRAAFEIDEMRKQKFYVLTVAVLEWISEIDKTYSLERENRLKELKDSIGVF